MYANYYFAQIIISIKIIIVELLRCDVCALCSVCCVLCVCESTRKKLGIERQTISNNILNGMQIYDTYYVIEAMYNMYIQIKLKIYAHNII